MPKTPITKPRSKAMPSKAKQVPRESYHHGNLREDALRLAIAHIEEHGASTLSIRGLATALGTAHRALYNHFTDRAALLATIAEAGFQDLARQTETTQSASAFASAYLDFALSRHHLYNLMMSQSTDAMAANNGLNAAVQDLITIASRVLSSAASGATQSRRDVMRVWMLLHGGINLHTNGMLQLRSNAAFIAEVLAIAGLEQA